MIRKAKAVWRGAGRDGSGSLTTDSGVFAGTPYSFKTPLRERERHQPGRTGRGPRFAMALAFRLQRAGFTPTELSAEAAAIGPLGLEYLYPAVDPRKQISQISHRTD